MSSIKNTLPHNFIGKNAGRYRSIERFNLTLHRNRCRHVALLPHKAAHALAFIADDEADLAGQIPLLHRLSRHVGADKPESGILELIDGIADIRHFGNRRVIERTG